MEHWGRDFRDKIKLSELDGIPWNHGVLLERWLAFFASLIKRRINIFKLSASGIVHDSRPSLISFAKSYCVRVARAAVTTKGFVGQFGNMWPSHDDRNPSGANCIGYAVGLGDHSRHGADADQSDILIANIFRDLRFIHRLSIPIDEQHFVSGRRQRLKQEHPQVRHEIPGHAVIRVVEKDSH